MPERLRPEVDPTRSPRSPERHGFSPAGKAVQRRARCATVHAFKMDDHSLARWLTGDWYRLLPAPWASVALSFAAVVCGTLVGTERERKGKPVGVHTLTLVSLGAATFTQLSTVLGGPDGEAARTIAAQIVSGVGFLGAGAILRGNVGVTGLTSAATIWAMAAVGMTAGAGYGGASLGLSVMIVAVLTVISAVERRYLGPCRYTTARVRFRAEYGKGRIKVEEVLDVHRVLPASRRWETPETDDAGQDAADPAVVVRYCYVHLQHKEFLVQLAQLPEVLEIAPENAACVSSNTESVKAGREVGPRADR